MCIGPSTIVRYLLNILLLAGLVLTLVALFTPQWRKYTFDSQDAKNLQNVKNAVDLSLNLIDCVRSVDSFLQCVNFTNGSDYQKATVGLLFVGAGTSAIALVWSVVVTCCLCCCCCGCQSCFTWPLLILSLCAAASDAIAVGIFALKSGDTLPTITTFPPPINFQNSIGYSMWIAIGAIGCFTLSSIMSILLLRLNKVVPI